MTTLSSTKTPRNHKPVSYEGFMGLDTSRSTYTRDTGGRQVLDVLDGAHCDEYGQIIRDPGYYNVLRVDGKRPTEHVVHMDFFAEGEVGWAYKTREGIGFESIRAHRNDPVWPSNANPSSTVFNNRLVMVAKALNAYIYDASKWSQAETTSYIQDYNPAYICTVADRAIIAGIPLKPTSIYFSATNEFRFYNEANDADSEAVTRPGFIDIRNRIGNAETITGISPFEYSRLAIFTQDRMLLYKTDPDITQWEIDNSANIHVGCISHNTIRPAGTDILFCSRSGVHSIQRSRDNGILVFSIAMSDRIKTLYRKLLNEVEDPSTIRAVFNQDTGQYHIFFPQKDDRFTKRLTMTLNPFVSEAPPKWSLTTFLNATCGAFLSGDCFLGTTQGVYLEAPQDALDADLYPDVAFDTPILWHGTVTDKKQTEAIVIQCEGSGRIELEVVDDQNNTIFSSVYYERYDGDDSSPRSITLYDQFKRDFKTEYRGARFRFRIKNGKGRFIFSGFAILLRT